MQVRRLTPDDTGHGVGVWMVRKAGRRAYMAWLDVSFVDAEDFSVLSAGQVSWVCLALIANRM